MTKTIFAWAAIAAFFAASVPVAALEPVEILILQYRLADHGFDAGKPDGRVGPKTRQAITAFTEHHGIGSSAGSAFDFMVKRSVGARISITRSETLEMVKAGVAERLRDPSSVMIRNVYRVTDADGTTNIVCGEVNGKNGYGGYTGYTTFTGFLLYSIESFSVIRIDTPSSRYASLTCTTSFPKAQFTNRMH